MLHDGELMSELRHRTFQNTAMEKKEALKERMIKHGASSRVRRCR